jgi:hypothetical protein
MYVVPMVGTTVPQHTLDELLPSSDPAEAAALAVERRMAARSK